MKTPEESMSQTTKRSVLVVDDERSIVKTIQMLLEDDYHVHGFDTPACGKVVIDWLKTGNKPDFAILDLLINGISGVDIARVILDLYGDDVPIVFLTGCDVKSPVFIEAKEILVESPGTQIFTKPYDRVKGVEFSDFIEQELARRFGDVEA
jgi:CheY-like chemotaxis protein